MGQTCAQICTLATQIAKCPAFTQQAGQFLNQRLEQWAFDYDFDTITKQVLINITPNGGDGPTASAPDTIALLLQGQGYALPVDHLRTKAALYNVNGSVFYMAQADLLMYYQWFQGPGILDYPQRYATDVSTAPHTIYFYPPPSQGFAVVVRYLPTATTYATPETSSTVPWFPDTKLLTDAVSADLMRITDDDRWSGVESYVTSSMNKYAKLQDDKENYAVMVALDRGRFRSAVGLKPTKQQWG